MNFMTNGPPSSAAGPSQSPVENSPESSCVPPLTQGYLPNSTQTAQHPSYPQTTNQPYYASVIQSSNSTSSSTTGNQPYYNPGATWKNGWSVATYPYSSGNPPAYQRQQHFPQVPYSQYQLQHYKSSDASKYISVSHTKPKSLQKSKAPSPSPTPPPQFHRHWNEVIQSFLTQLGLTQALRGFESDMVIMNSEWERMKVPGALDDLMKNLLVLGQVDTAYAEKGEETNSNQAERSLEERKLDYVYLSNGTEPRSQTSINKSISSFLAQNRARNDASNRTEFLCSVVQQRRRSREDSVNALDIPSCARADAKPIDRDVQMKYDIAKNEDGPLRRTVRHQGKVASDSGVGTEAKRKKRKVKERQKREIEVKAEPVEVAVNLTSDRHPGLDQRLVNIETHFSVRYVPSPPHTLLARLKFLEDHITRLEKDYPPWAALHFNQPNRGWPPPPRSTPIIVPPHLRHTNKDLHTNSSLTPLPAPPSAPITTGGVKARNTASSLHRAVMERLEVKKALNDLAGGGEQ